MQLQREVRSLGRLLRWRRRFRLTVRALWLGLLVVVVGLGVRVLGIDLRWPFFVFPAGFVFAALAIAGWWSNPSLHRLLRGFDHHFQTQELLASGLEVARRTAAPEAEPTAVEQRLVEQTLLAIYAVRRQVLARPFFPLPDVEMLLAVALIAVGLMVMSNWSALPQISPLAIQPLPSAVAEEPAQAPQATNEPVSSDAAENREQMSPEDRAAADALADGLRDNGATRPAAGALDEGDASGAASRLRELADQADQLSPEARGGIAQGLRDAADQLQGEQPERAERLEQDANALEGAPQEAAGALDDLASLVDELGGQNDATANGGDNAQDDPGTSDGQGDDPGQPAGDGGAGSGGGGTGNGLGGESRGGASSPPTAGDETMPLPPAPDTGAQRAPATGPQGPAVQLDAGGTRGAAPSSQGASGGGADSPLSGEADPLRIPPEYRDVVEKYFSPVR